MVHLLLLGELHVSLNFSFIKYQTLICENSHVLRQSQ